jgi:hypothetical protein
MTFLVEQSRGSNDLIKTDKNNTCKTCVMLITSPEFTSNLTGKTYYTKSFDPLDCSTKNVIYGIECTLCGLLYVGENSPKY